MVIRVGRGRLFVGILVNILFQVVFGFAEFALEAAGAGLKFAFGLEAAVAGEFAGGFFDGAFNFAAGTFGNISGTWFHISFGLNLGGAGGVRHGENSRFAFRSGRRGRQFDLYREV